MAKVTIHTKSGETIEVKATSKDDERFYEDLPFNSENVMVTQVEET